MFSTEYILEEITFATTVLVSISNQKYTINNTLHFNIEFGRKADIYTHVYIAKNDLEPQFVKRCIIYSIKFQVQQLTFKSFSQENLEAFRKFGGLDFWCPSEA
uniref:Uncharacterized protein n=1 Tax=Meloidogyne enterolobii TaxID=390850 RepID=A0A6V7VRJ7_MELEN|nr:unnamed protein product [Meloidogyne enterolobii]